MQVSVAMFIFAHVKYIRKMKLNRLILGLCIAAFLGAVPAGASAQYAAAGIEEEVLPVKISVSENTSQEVRVQNAEGQKLEVYNLIGVRVSVFRIDSADKTITLGVQRGCYILKVGKVVRKVFVR